VVPRSAGRTGGLQRIERAASDDVPVIRAEHAVRSISIEPCGALIDAMR
jgi:hypothetical protein